MNIYTLNFSDKRIDNKKLNNKYNPNFNGEIAKTVGTLQLTNSEILQVQRISNHYNQLKMMFKTAGNYISNLFKTGITFLIPVGAAFSVINSLASNDVNNVEFEQNQNGDESDNSITFTLKNNDREAFLKLVVPKTGNMDVIVDEDLTDTQINKYRDGINKSHGEIFDSILGQTTKAINLIGEILNKDIDYNFDLNSKSDMQRVVNQFIDEKKNISLLTKLIHLTKFMKRFEFDEGMPHKMEEGELKDKDICFSFSNLNNQFFDAMRVTAVNRRENTVQGFVALQDGSIYKTKKFSIKNNVVPRIEWGIRKLDIMSPEELEDSDLQQMFQYAYSHTDKMYRGMMSTLYRIEKKAGEEYENAGPRKKALIERSSQRRLDTIEQYSAWKDAQNAEMATKTSKISDAQLDIAHAKVFSVHKLNDEVFSKIKRIDDYYDRISEAYSEFSPELRDIVTERTGINRKKYINGYVFNDILKTKDLYIGVARYTFGIKRHELINFGIFNKDYEEMARFKIMPDGSMNLIVKPTDTSKFNEEIEKMFNNELENGLLDRLSERMDDLCYYHEHVSQVNRYITKAGNLTALQAIKEIRNGKTYYNADIEKMQKLKNDLEIIKNIYFKNRGTIYNWQKEFFSDNPNVQSRYLHGYINELKLNYEFAFTKNEHVQGLRIALRDNNGDCVKCYMIDYNGNVYKLVKLPSKENPQKFYIHKANLHQLGINEASDEKIDIILNEIYKNIDAYKGFLEEHSSKHTIRQCKTLPKEVGTTKPVVKKKRTNVKKETKSRKKPVEKTPQQPEQKIIATTTVEPIKAQNGKTTVVKLPEDPAEIEKRIELFKSINMLDVWHKIKQIFETPYDKRSPHLIHDTRDGEVCLNRVSYKASDEAWVTVSMFKSGIDYTYPSIRVQKDKKVMYLKINPDSGRIFRCDKNNKIMRDSDNNRRTIEKGAFAKDNPLTANMLLYLDELFAFNPEAVRETMPWQMFENEDKIAQQAKLDSERAMRIQEWKRMTEAIEEELIENGEEGVEYFGEEFSTY